jgi:hypothetical protein
VAFGLSTYSIILLEVGHVTKLFAIVFMAPVVGAFILAYRRNLLWGIILSAVFMALELGSNHVQITYYLGFILLAIGIYEFIEAIRYKTYKKFAFATIGILAAYGLAAMTGAANLLPTQKYAEQSIRGANDLSISPDLTSNHTNSTDGLDKDYVTGWSYGKSESLTFFIPFAKGGKTVAIGNGNYTDKLMNSDFSKEEKEYINGSNQYWADQPGTSGPVYFGALTFLLAVLGMFFIKSPIKWPLFAVSVLTLLLSWGKNLMWFTDFFLEHVPLYNKFRAVTIILVVMQVTIPLLAMLFLNELWKNKEAILEQKKKFFIISGAFLGFMLLLIASPSLTGLNSQAEKDQLQNADVQIESSIRSQIAQMSAEQLQQYGVNPNDKEGLEQFIQKVTQQQVESFQNNFPALKSFRTSIFREDATRSFLFMAIGLILVLLIMRSKSTSNQYFLLGGIGLLILIDMTSVDLKFLNQDEYDNRDEFKQWMPADYRMYPLAPNTSDEQILGQEMSTNPALENAVIKAEQDAIAYTREKEFSPEAKRNYIQNERFRAYNRMTHFRVVDLTENVFNSSRASYFHESIGGYHGAKLRRYQNMIEFGYLPSNQTILGMLNTKYIVQGTVEQPNVRINPSALGNAWLVPSIEYVKNSNEAILSLGNRYKIDAKNNWNIYVNDEKKNNTTVYGRENIFGVKGQDTVRFNWPNGLTAGVKASYVRDVNGSVNWVPAMTLENDTANSFETIVNMEVTYSFQPKDVAVVLDEYKSYLGKDTFTAQGTVELVKSDLNDLKYNFNSSSDQLVVFSEVYYPIGWKVTIDGKDAEYIPVNYILRGIKVPAGKHTIEFNFVDETYNTGLIIARISSWLIILLLIGGIGKEVYARTKKEN